MDKVNGLIWGKGISEQFTGGHHQSVRAGQYQGIEAWDTHAQIYKVNNTGYKDKKKLLKP